jgi:feruloyl esterase
VLTSRVIMRAAVTAVVTSALSATTSAATCESVASLALPNATITSAETLAAGAFAPTVTGRGRGGRVGDAFKDLPAFCRVTGTVTRPGDTDVKFEVWMPAAGWRGEFQLAASGFGGGTISYGQMAQLLRQGMATANTNRGHDGGGPWKPADMAGLPYHLAVEQSKAILTKYYDKRPAFTVMDECGNGGSRDVLQLVQGWGGDLDAAAAVGQVYWSTHHGVAQMWIYAATHKDEASYIPPVKYAVIHQAALDACDAKDGLRDGVIEDPDHCKYDPGVLLCKNGDAPNCLTAPQVETVRKIYSPPLHARTGERLYSPMMPGSELGWEAMAGPTPYQYIVPFYRNLVFKDPNWDYKTQPANFDADVDAADAPANLPINANNPDISPFVARGGKLLLVGGWNDHTLGARGPLDYYEQVVAKVGANKIKDSVRLFMVPAMDHCFGETYAFSPTTTFDNVPLLRQWKMSNKAPNEIVVTQSAPGRPDHRRLVCAYPRVAHYKGRGDTEDPANFVCQAPGA